MLLSTAPQVFAGRATVQFGGERGITKEVSAGDLIVIPAGVAHKCLQSSADFGVVGCYPEGQEPDMMHGAPGERPAADHCISTLALPQTDPLQGHGRAGPLATLWGPKS